MEVAESKYLKEPITWSRTLDAEFPYKATYDNQILTLRINDFPEEHFYSLLLDDEEIATFDDWPGSWTRDEDDNPPNSALVSPPDRLQ